MPSIALVWILLAFSFSTTTVHGFLPPVRPASSSTSTTNSRIHHRNLNRIQNHCKGTFDESRISTNKKFGSLKMGTTTEDELKRSSRRQFFTTSTTVATNTVSLSSLLFFMVQPSRPALALKPKNEQLCGTGFFTNYLEYKCTDIGDISDEGQRTSLSASEQGAADSLLSKLNLDLTNSDDNNNDAMKNNVKNNGADKSNGMESNSK